MADKKISELTNITGANLADADEFVVVDTSANETKAITYAELKSGLDTSTGFVRVTGDTMTGDLSFGDNNKAIFGAGSDLQIYHDGLHSRISEVGTGNLKIQATDFEIINAANNEYVARFITDGAVTLYHDNAAKFATTSTGVDVTGTVTADGLTVDGVARIQGAATGIVINETDTTDLNTYLNGNNGSFRVLSTNDAFSLFKERINVNHTTGDISFYEDTGTTPKLFWDASAEALGIGTTSPTNVKLQINGSLSGTAGTGHLAFGEASTPLWNWRMDATTADLMLDRSYGGWQSTPVIAFDRSSGNVGIGTSSPSAKLHVVGETNGTLRVDTSASGYLDLSMYSNGGFVATSTAQPLRLGTNNTERMRITSSGNVGIGTTSPAYTLDIAGGPHIYYDAGNSLGIFSASAGNDVSILARASQNLRLSAGGSERLRITSSGNVGIGTSAPAFPLEVRTASGGRVRFGDGTNNLDFFPTTGQISTGGDVLLKAFGASGIVSFSTGIGAPERLRIDASGNVGIGTSSPTSTYATSLHVNTSGNNAGIRLTGGTSTAGFDFVADSAATYIYNRNNTPTLFATNGTERMRIDTSGNLLVGKTATDIGTVGHQFLSDGQGDYAAHTSNGTRALLLNRKTSDGEILDFRKDGTTVGSIGVFSSDNLGITGSAASHAGVIFGTNQVLPASSGTYADAAVDVGNTTTRFKDLYLSGGVYLGGTGSANLLDDYEEGDYSISNLSGLSINYSNIVTRGRYVKIGKLVTAYFYAQWDTVNVGSGNASLPLPFTPTTNTNGSGNLIIYVNGAGTGIAADHLWVYCVGGNSNLYFRQRNSGGKAQITDKSQLFTSGTNYIDGIITYYTDA